MPTFLSFIPSSETGRGAGGRRGWWGLPHGVVTWGCLKIEGLPVRSHLAACPCDVRLNSLLKASPFHTLSKLYGKYRTPVLVKL